MISTKKKKRVDPQNDKLKSNLKKEHNTTPHKKVKNQLLIMKNPNGKRRKKIVHQRSLFSKSQNMVGEKGYASIYLGIHKSEATKQQYQKEKFSIMITSQLNTKKSV